MSPVSDLSNHEELHFKVGNTTFRAASGKNGRWYGHEKRNGRIINDFSYKTRGSCRRAMKKFVARLVASGNF